MGAAGGFVTAAGVVETVDFKTGGGFDPAVTEGNGALAVISPAGAETEGAAIVAVTMTGGSAIAEGVADAAGTA